MEGREKERKWTEGEERLEDNGGKKGKSRGGKIKRDFTVLHQP